MASNNRAVIQSRAGRGSSSAVAGSLWMIAISLVLFFVPLWGVVAGLTVALLVALKWLARSACPREPSEVAADGCGRA